MKSRSLLFSLTLFCIALINSNAVAVDIVDDTAGLTATLNLPTVSSSLATGPGGYAFTVGPNAIILTNISFGIYGNAAGTANVGVSLYSSTGAGGTAIQTSGTTLLSINAIGTAQYYSYSINWSLNANATYTVAAYYTTGGTTTPRLATTSQTLSTDSSVTGLGFYKGSSTTADQYAMRLQGTTSVPEPSTMILAISTVLTLFLIGKRSRQTVTS